MPLNIITPKSMGYRMFHESVTGSFVVDAMCRLMHGLAWKSCP